MKKTITLKGEEMSEFAQGLTADRISKMRLSHIEGCMDTKEEEGYIKVHFEISDK